ncbi:MAG: type I glutamate--ammonia ligase, partial [Halanaerobiales bacterium]
LRNPDPTENPYLAIAVMLKAGLDGIKNEIEPPEEVVKNIYELTDDEKEKNNIDSLPGNVKEAVAVLQQDEVIKDALGEHVFEHFVEAKEVEWDSYKSQVHPWEIDQYLNKY